MGLNKLRGELVTFGIKQREVADFLGMTANNFNRKLSEAVPFTRDEMYAIRDEFFPERSIDYLFQSDGDKPTYEEQLSSYAEMVHEYATREKGRDARRPA